MINLTLLTKAWNGGQLRQIDDLLHNQFADLDIDVKVLGNPVNRWVKVSVEGEDEAVAAAYMRRELGVCPVGFNLVEDGMVLKGYVSKLDVEHQRLMVDIGVFEPRVVQVGVSLLNLQSQLAGDENVGLKQIAEAYAITEGVPLGVKIISKSADVLEAELSVEQVVKLQGWSLSLLDRLIVLRTSAELVSEVLERTRLNRDVIAVESLGFFEFVLVCKLGTDAMGLVPRLGRYMRNAVFVVFDAKKSRVFGCGSGLTL
ncbi:MAG: DUF2110 family protein [Nitrososphaerota archaeon]|jgi:hypothetical protein|nr:DUF2110 family protein [Nitrososphaerota archaeon]